MPEELGGIQKDRGPSRWDPPAELRERVAHAHRTSKADLRTADWIHRVLVEHRRAEDTVGGRALWPVVQSQLQAVLNLLPHASGDAADRLLVLAAEHAHWLSWVAHSENHKGAAIAWLDLASGWALDAGAADMTSWVHRVRAYYTLQAGDPKRALRTAEAARWGPGPLHPAAASVATHAAAMAAAATADRDRARRLADEAYELALSAQDHEGLPGWLYWLSPARARLERANASYAVHDWAEAAEGFKEALESLIDYPRDHAYYAARLSDAERRA